MKTQFYIAYPIMDEFDPLLLESTDTIERGYYFLTYEGSMYLLSKQTPQEILNMLLTGKASENLLLTYSGEYYNWFGSGDYPLYSGDYFWRIYESGLYPTFLLPIYSDEIFITFDKFFEFVYTNSNLFPLFLSLLSSKEAFYYTYSYRFIQHVLGIPITIWDSPTFYIIDRNLTGYIAYVVPRVDLHYYLFFPLEAEVVSKQLLPLQITVVQKHQTITTLQAKVISMLNFDLELLDSQHFKVTWEGEPVPAIEILVKSITEKNYGKPYAVVPFEKKEYIITLDKQPYDITIRGLNGTGITLRTIRIGMDELVRYETTVDLGYFQKILNLGEIEVVKTLNVEVVI